MSTTLPKGIYRRPDGWQVAAKVNKQFVSQRFPFDTEMSVMIDARKTMIAQARLGMSNASVSDGETTFAQDVKDYLKAKAGMPTITDRTHRIEWWRDQLGRTRSRASVTALEVRKVLEVKRKAGAANGTLNVYRTALMDFYTVLNGQEGSNPARGVPKYREEELPLTLPTRDDAVRAVEASIHAKGPRDGGTKSQARLRVLLWTGWPSAILKKLQKQHINWKDGTATLYGRKKGGGTRPRTVPLLPPAVEALKTFASLEAWGPFSGSALHSTLHRGCDAAGVRRFRVYDLRHLFATNLVENSRDERGAAELMLHTSPNQTWRYSRAAASARAVSTINAMVAALKADEAKKKRATNSGRPRLVRRQA